MLTKLKCYLGVISLLLVGCAQPDPQNDIALFQPFISENINKSSDDPYISSLYQPEDELYDFLVSAQNRRRNDDLLKTLIAENDSKAIYWLAISNVLLPYERVKSFELLNKAIELGNPYAAMGLSHQNPDCEFYFSEDSAMSHTAKIIGQDTSLEKKACSKEYAQIAVDLLKPLAEKGDLQAQYALLKLVKPNGDLIDEVGGYRSGHYYLNHSKETRELYIKEVIRFAQNHYYRPLMDYVSTILTKIRPSAQPKAKNPEVEELAIDLLQIAANHNYEPAIITLIDYKQNTIQPDDPLFKKAIKLGSSQSLSWFFILLREVAPKNDVYALMKLHDLIICEEPMPPSCDSNVVGLTVLDMLPDESTRNELDKEAQKLYENTTPMVYFDEFIGWNFKY